MPPGTPHLQGRSPDLVLLDVILPGADGLSPCRPCAPRIVTVPVIMLTGTKAVKTAVDAMKLGAADYLSPSRSMSKNSKS